MLRPNLDVAFTVMKPTYQTDVNLQGHPVYSWRARGRFHSWLTSVPKLNLLLTIEHGSSSSDTFDFYSEGDVFKLGENIECSD
jgi:hypothetical protein